MTSSVDEEEVHDQVRANNISIIYFLWIHQANCYLDRVKSQPTKIEWESQSRWAPITGRSFLLCGIAACHVLSFLTIQESVDPLIYHVDGLNVSAYTLASWTELFANTTAVSFSVGALNSGQTWKIHYPMTCQASKRTNMYNVHKEFSSSTQTTAKALSSDMNDIMWQLSERQTNRAFPDEVQIVSETAARMVNRRWSSRHEASLIMASHMMTSLVLVDIFQDKAVFCWRWMLAPKLTWCMHSILLTLHVAVSHYRSTRPLL